MNPRCALRVSRFFVSLRGFVVFGGLGAGVGGHYHEWGSFDSVLGQRMDYSRRNRIRIGLIAVLAALALVLLLGPSWVEPVHPDAGVPYTQLPASHPDHLPLYAPQRAMARRSFSS